MSEKIKLYKEQFDSSYQAFLQIVTEANNPEKQQKMERTIIGIIDNIIADLDNNDESIVNDLMNVLYVENKFSKEVMLKGCELAKRSQEITGKEDLYVRSLLKCIKHLNEHMIYTIIKTTYFANNNFTIIHLFKDYIVREEKYNLLSSILWELSELRCSNYKEMVINYIEMMDPLLKTAPPTPIPTEPNTTNPPNKRRNRKLLAVERNKRLNFNRYLTVRKLINEKFKLNLPPLIIHTVQTDRSNSIIIYLSFTLLASISLIIWILYSNGFLELIEF